MERGPSEEGRQALKEFQGRHDDMRRPITARRFELQEIFARRFATQPFVAKQGDE